MARNLDAKCRQCRREGEKLFLKGDKCFTDKCAIERRWRRTEPLPRRGCAKARRRPPAISRHERSLPFASHFDYGAAHSPCVYDLSGSGMTPVRGGR